MKVNISFNCDNACFDGDHAAEINRILQEIGAKIQDSRPFGPQNEEEAAVFDRNGNVIGKWNIEGY